MLQQMALDIRLKADCLFENFQAGVNQQVIDSIKSPDAVQTNLFLWGGLGLGKTHLLIAACHDYQLRFPGRPLMYLDLSDPTIPPDALEGMEFCSLVCLDGLDQILGEAAWEDALFHFLNRMKDAEHRWIASSRKPLAQLSISLPDLKSRLGAALQFELKALSSDQNIEVFREKARSLGLDLEDDVVAYLSKRAPRDLSSLLELLDILDAKSLEHKRAVTVPFLKQWVSW